MGGLIILALLIISCIYFYYFNNSSKPFTSLDNIFTIKTIYPPSIINSQSYYFVHTKYKNISFNQCVRSNDGISDSIKNTGRWEE